MNAVKVSQQSFVTLQHPLTVFSPLHKPHCPSPEMFLFPSRWTLIMFSTCPWSSQPYISPSSSAPPPPLIVLCLLRCAPPPPPPRSHLSHYFLFQWREQLRPVSTHSSLNCYLALTHSCFCVPMHHFLCFSVNLSRSFLCDTGISVSLSRRSAIGITAVSFPRCACISIASM